jgi:Domain of unknown function (DUF4386)
MISTKSLARIAGSLYLTVAIFGGFAHLYARARIYVPGDAAATADNIVANSALFRFAFVADLIQATVFMLLGMALYLLLRHVNENIGRAMVVFVAISVAIICLNMIHHLAALLVATDASYASTFGPEGSNALVLLLVDMHHYGYLIAQIFFGLWLLPLGYLVYKSGMFPRALGVLLMIGCFGYLIDTLALFLVPNIGGAISTFVVIPAAIAEFWMVFYLLIKGVRAPQPEQRVLAPV